ncbi:MAG: hypothetical protein HY062_04430 [Bacteroidetes bacterium]|nr:hypothetical protein [Bacteroidota bacterium]
MHTIDIHNYEAYLLDFSEGNLTDELQMELELFLIQHPELNIDLADVSFVSLNDEAVSFSHKNSLKKSDADLVSEVQFVSYIENQLSQHERIALEKSCALNPSLSKELALYQNTIAIADKSVVYTGKPNLKRKPKVIWFNVSLTQYAAAACVLCLIGLFMLWPKDNGAGISPSLANNTPTTHSRIAPHSTNTPVIADNLVKEHSASKKQEGSAKASLTLPANTNTPEEKPANLSVPKDTTTPLMASNIPSITETHKNETILPQNLTPVAKQSSQTVVQVITESEDEGLIAVVEKKKKGVWAAASRALKNLNQVGLKSVNGDEEASKEKTAYALTLGGINITHKSGNL